MRPETLGLYLVTDPVLCRTAGVVPTVSAAVAAGVTAVQLRDPHADDREFVTVGRALVAALDGTGVPLIVNDRVGLVAAIGAAGAHVGQGDLSVAQTREMLGPDALLGLSVQTVEHVDVALGGPLAAIDYLGVGPVWAQATKPDAAAPGGPDELARLVARSPWPCVAIGGITEDRASAVRAAGAAGMAVVSAICGQPDVGAAVRRLQAAWDADVAGVRR
jgi:thiamine-phosphate pyrophosphorylase